MLMMNANLHNKRCIECDLQRRGKLKAEQMSTKKTISPIPRLSLSAIHGDNSTGPHFDTDDMGIRLVFPGIMIEVSLSVPHKDVISLICHF